MSKVKLCDSCEYTNNCSYKSIKPKNNDLTKDYSYYSKDENLTSTDLEKLRFEETSVRQSCKHEGAFVELLNQEMNELMESMRVQLIEKIAIVGCTRTPVGIVCTTCPFANIENCNAYRMATKLVDKYQIDELKER